MNSKRTQLTTIAVLVCLLLAALVINGCAGCGKKTEQTASMQMQQMVCPISGMPINKDISTEYKGRKVYFCSPACKAEFEKNPEKYAGKLPQCKTGTN